MQARRNTRANISHWICPSMPYKVRTWYFSLDDAIQPPDGAACQRSKFLATTTTRTIAFVLRTGYSWFHCNSSSANRRISSYSWPPLVIFVIFVPPSPDRPRRMLRKRVSKWPIVENFSPFSRITRIGHRSVWNRLKPFITVRNWKVYACIYFVSYYSIVSYLNTY